MDRNEELINKRYDALMFARNTEEAKRAAKLLIESVLGESGSHLPLEEGLKQVCRRLRPAEDTRDQARFEAEFLELAFAPSGSAETQSAVKASTPPQTPTRRRAA